MIYSGVDLIRQAESTYSRAEKLTGTAPVAPADTQDQPPDQNDALLRFARFLHKEKKRKPSPKPSAQSYSKAFARLSQIEDRGQLLNIYA